MSGTWTDFDAPKVAGVKITADTMLLLSDGSVLVHQVFVSGSLDGSVWMRLTPDKTGNYETGSWSGPFKMINQRQYFASGITTDARVYVVGGETSDDLTDLDTSGMKTGNDCPLGEMFDPTTNTWSAINKPAAFVNIRGDVASSGLADGRVLMGSLIDSGTAVFDPTNGVWDTAGVAFGNRATPSKDGDTNEETWNLLPNGDVVTVEIAPSASNTTANPAERYSPATDLWTAASGTPSALVISTVACTFTPAGGVAASQSATVSEIGPALLLADGTLFAIGATGHTAIYTPTSNTWAPGPDFPADTGSFTQTDPAGNKITWTSPTGLQTSADAPAVLLPGGQVLCCAGNLVPELDTKGNIALTPSGTVKDFFSQPTNYYLFDPANAANGLVLLPKQPSSNGGFTWTSRLLLLPNGKVLLSNNSSTMSIYSPSADELQPAVATPVVSNANTAQFPSRLILGHAYTVAGTGFNGASQANSYGDDAQMATNFPLVRISSGSEIRYLRTTNFSSLGVDVTASGTFDVQIPTDLTPGPWSFFVVANGIASTAIPVTIASQNIFCIVDRSTVGQGEVDGIIKLLGAPATFSPALYVVAEGFSATDLGGLNASNAASPPILPSIPNPVGNFSVKFAGSVIAEDWSLPSGSIQRFTYPFEYVFPDDSAFSGAPLNATITATLTAGATVTASAQIGLLNTPNPYILHGDQAGGFPWYLSVDIRVFQMVADGTTTKFGESIATSGNASDLATTFITNVIDNINGDKTALESAFEALPQLEDTAVLTLAPTDGTHSVFNFALARVRFQDANQDINNVRLLFRMWAAQQTNAVYDTSTLFRSAVNAPGQVIPLFGVEGDEILSIPFFASKRVDATQVAMSTQTDAPNVQTTIKHDPFGGRVDTFFGCWLDINQPSQTIYPSRLVGGAGAVFPDGPFKNVGPLVSIQQLVKGAHQCLIAEVSFPGLTIPANADPSTSDKLAQRNLAFVNVPNPGLADSRLAPQLLEIKPSSAVSAGLGAPDELMILWGDIPTGTTAQIYLPAVPASQVLTWARKLYTTQQLSAVDARTIQCKTGGVTYLPVPQGSGAAIVGLMSVELPAGIHKGELFDVTVRQVTRETQAPVSVGVVLERAVRTRQLQASLDKGGGSWRRISGIFNLRIPVTTKAALLSGEEQYLAIMKYNLQSTPLASRWYAALKRFVEQLSAKVDAMGGNAGAIQASGNGLNTGKGNPIGEPGQPARELVGKVAGLSYDHFGDFDGFLLETDHCVTHRIASGECKVETLARAAWQERSLVTVVLDIEKNGCLKAIIVGGQPSHCTKCG